MTRTSLSPTQKWPKTIDTSNALLLCCRQKPRVLFVQV